MVPSKFPVSLKPIAWFCLMLILFVAGGWAEAPKSAAVAPTVKGSRTLVEALPPPRATSGANPQAAILREGTELVEQVGQFRITGDRVTFFMSNGTGRLIVLENLNLQRIVRILSENPASLDWKVTGLVTEYRGGNYLFVRSAVLKAGTEVRENVAP